jgi:hypothetical protein
MNYLDANHSLLNRLQFGIWSQNTLIIDEAIEELAILWALNEKPAATPATKEKIAYCTKCKRRKKQAKLYGNAHYSMCHICREKAKTYHKTLRDDRKENGICRMCKKPTSHGIRCVDCADKYNAKRRLHYDTDCKKNRDRQYAKDNGICIDCLKNKAVPGMVRCDYCLEKNNENRKSLTDDV